MSFSSKLSDKDRAVINSIFNPHLPLGEVVNDEELLDDDIEFVENENAKRLEIEAIQFAENGEFEKSLNTIEQVYLLCPTRPATFNNRAQIHRLMGNTEAAFSDLMEALKLSKIKGKTYCQALCQRGILYKKLGQNDDARKDFQEAANLGSSFAKQQIIDLNPYAALCNQMLSQVMHKLN